MINKDKKSASKKLNDKNSGVVIKKIIVSSKFKQVQYI